MLDKNNQESAATMRKPKQKEPVSIYMSARLNIPVLTGPIPSCKKSITLPPWMILSARLLIPPPVMTARVKE